jgi:tRNA(fMet)-specific endonuclease VapC
MHLLDTNTLIYFFKGQGRVAEHLLAHSPAELGVPAIVLHELEYGLARSQAPARRKAQLAEFMRVARLIEFDAACARAAGALRFELEAVGTPIGPFDALIAATALAHGSVLVTHNTREFSRIAGLRLEDWYD